MEFRELTERYDLEKILRSGRTSTVMRATDRQSGRTVAVKMIQAVLLVPPDAFPEAASRFHAYASALEALHHPCLPETLDAGITPDGSAFLVTELVEGRGLDTVAGKLPPSDALALLAPMLDALEALASRGMAHGNLSPDNVVLLGDRLEGGQVKLLGLGSSVFRTGQSASTAPAESARFLAPELARGGVPGAPSDLYSYGRTVCHLLGASVGPGDSPPVQLPFPVTLEVTNDAPLREILERLLRKDPAERPAFPEVRTAFQKAWGKTLLETPSQPLPAPAATPASVVPPGPETIPEGTSEGNVFLDITDELLDSLQGAPPPPPVQAPVQEKEEAAAEPPPARSRRTILRTILIAAAALILLVVLAGIWLLRRSPSETASAPDGSPAVVVPPPPSAQATLARMEEIRTLLAQGEDDKALEAFRSLSFHDQSSLPPEACARLADLEGTLSLLAVERLPADLERGLKSGDLGLLRSVAATGSGLGGSLPAELQESFGKARSLVELHRLAEADAAEGRHVAVLERFAEMTSLAPNLSDPLELREKAAAAVEGEAEALAREARYDEAVARLEPLQRTWSGRDGLAARALGYRKYKEDEARQKEILATIPAWERRKRPHEGLELLRGVDPTPHLRPQIEAARKRLEQELLQLDGKPPEVILRDGYSLEYQRTHTAELSFRVEDDYEVRDVKLMMRLPGGRMRETPLDDEEVRSRGSWSIEIPFSLHQNGTVELYVVATDRSGNKGYFGSPDQPKKLTLIGSNRGSQM